jgi:hypothetical protein
MTMLRTLLAAALIASGTVCGGCATDVTDESSASDPDNPNPSPSPNPNPNPTPEISGCTATAWDGQIQIGGGESCFEEVIDGGGHPLIAGGQGGYHVWMALRCRDCAGAQLLSYGVQNVDTGEWLMGQSQQQMVDMLVTGDYFETGGLQAPMPGDSWNEEGNAYLGQSFRLWIQADIAGQIYEESVVVVLDSIDYWWPPCDEDEECFG